MQLHPSWGGDDDPGDVANAGAWVIYRMVNSHAPNKQLFLEAGSEEVLRGILSNEESSHPAKACAINNMVGSHAPNKQLFLEAGAEEVLRGILTNEETSNTAKSNARDALKKLGLQV